MRDHVRYLDVLQRLSQNNSHPIFFSPYGRWPRDHHTLQQSRDIIVRMRGWSWCVPLSFSFENNITGCMIQLIKISRLLAVLIFLLGQWWPFSMTSMIGSRYFFFVVYCPRVANLGMWERKKKKDFDFTQYILFGFDTLAGLFVN